MRWIKNYIHDHIKPELIKLATIQKNELKKIKIVKANKWEEKLAKN
jgi:hypothetical protein